MSHNRAVAAVGQAMRHSHRIGDLCLPDLRSEFDSVCPACGQIDDLRHKSLHCPATAHLQNEPSWEHLRSLPHHQLVLGIWDVLPGLQGFAGQISEVKPPLIFRVLGEGVHLFTDGSTSLPKEPLLSLSAWAIVLAETGVDTLEATRVWGRPYAALSKPITEQSCRRSWLP